MQAHLAGPSDFGTHLMDTHDAPVLGRASGRCTPRCRPPTGGVSTLLEWDANIPAWDDLLAELAKAGRGAQRLAARRRAPGRRASAGPWLNPTSPTLQRWMQGAILGQARRPAWTR